MRTVYDPHASGDLFSWHRADALVTSAGGIVTAWEDLSGNGRQLLPIPSSGVYTHRYQGYAVAGTKGRRGVRCTESVYTAPRCVSGLSPRSLFLVVSRTFPNRWGSGAAYCWLGAITPGVQGFTFSVDGNTRHYGGGQGGIWLSGIDASPTEAVDVLLYSYDGSTAIACINGTVHTVGRDDTISSAGSSALYVGGREDLVYPITATIHEVVQHTRAHTAAELARIAAAYAAQYR